MSVSGASACRASRPSSAPTPPPTMTTCMAPTIAPDWARLIRRRAQPPCGFPAASAGSASCEHGAPLARHLDNPRTRESRRSPGGAAGRDLGVGVRRLAEQRQAAPARRRRRVLANREFDAPGTDVDPVALVGLLPTFDRKLAVGGEWGRIRPWRWWCVPRRCSLGRWRTARRRRSSGGRRGQALRHAAARGDPAGVDVGELGAADRGDVDDRRVARAQGDPRVQRAWDRLAGP